MSGRRSLMIVGGVQISPIDGERGVFIKSGSTVISSAMKMTGATVSSGQSQYIYSRGVAAGGTIGISGRAYISNGGLMSASLVSGGITFQEAGDVYILSGGTAIDMYASTRGYLYCSSNGTLVSPEVLPGANMYVFAGGVVISPIFNGGNATLSSGATGVSGVVYSGQYTARGNISATVLSGGGVIVIDGGMAEDTVVSSGSLLRTSSAGVASRVIVEWRGRSIVYPGGVDSVVTVESGGELAIAGGIASQTTVLSGGSMIVSSGGVAYNTTAVNGGRMFVYSGATINNTSASEYADGFAVSASGAVVSGLDAWNASAFLSNCVAENISAGTDLGQYNARVSCYGGTVTNATAGPNTLVGFNSGCSAMGTATVGSKAYMPIDGNSYVENLVALTGCICSAARCTINNLILSGGAPTLSNEVMLNSITTTDVRGTIQLTGSSSIDGYAVSGYNVALYNGALCSNLTITDDGRCIVYNGGRLISPTINSGGSLTINSGGTALAVTSQTGATVTVLEGGYIEYVE